MPATSNRSSNEGFTPFPIQPTASRRRRSCRTVAPRRLGHLSLDHGAGDPRGAAHGRGLLRRHGADGGDAGAEPNGSHGAHCAGGAGDAGEGGGEASAGWEMGRYII